MMESAYTLEGGGQALVLLPDAAQTPDALAPLSHALHAGGLTVSVPALELGARPWRESVVAARAAFVRLRERHVCVSVCGLGAGAWAALMLAEEYTPEHLIIVAQESASVNRRARWEVRRLRRRASIDLFALSTRAQAHTASPERQAVRQASRFTRLLRLPAAQSVGSGELSAAICRRMGLYEPAGQPEPSLT